MAKYLVISTSKKLAKSYGRRLGKDFINLLDAYIEAKLKRACEVHNGGKQTLDPAVAGYVGIKP